MAFLSNIDADVTYDFSKCCLTTAGKVSLRLINLYVHCRVIRDQLLAGDFATIMKLLQVGKASVYLIDLFKFCKTCIILALTALCRA